MAILIFIVMLVFHQFKKSYSGHEPVLIIPELILNSGIYWLKGKNGSGKTSLIKSVAGLIPFDGDIQVRQLSIKQQRVEYRKIVNYAEAEPVYPPFLTGKDLVRFYEQAKGKMTQQHLELFHVLEIDRYWLKKTATYSSGMTKKLSLLLSFIGEPVLILLDEPLITLDVQATPRIISAIETWHRKGTSFVLSSHQERPVEEKLISSVLELQDKTIKQCS